MVWLEPGTQENVCAERIRSAVNCEAKTCGIRLDSHLNVESLSEVAAFSVIGPYSL